MPVDCLNLLHSSRSCATKTLFGLVDNEHSDVAILPIVERCLVLEDSQNALYGVRGSKLCAVGQNPIALKHASRRSMEKKPMAKSTERCRRFEKATESVAVEKFMMQISLSSAHDAVWRVAQHQPNRAEGTEQS